MKAFFSSLLRTSRLLFASPPGQTWRKIRHSLPRRAQNLRLRWFGLEISEAAYRKALQPGCPPDQVDCWDGRAQFFLRPAQREEVISVLRSRFPDAEEDHRRRANQVCEHVFDLLGSGPCCLGTQIDWQTDFLSGHRWPAQAYGFECHPAPDPGGYDIKVPWELSRCHHLVWLGQAYWFTGSDRYIDEFTGQISSWIRQNPVGYGPNWACTMDTAIRAVNWLWAFAFFEASPRLDPEFRRSFFRSLLAHGRYIFNHLEKSADFATNHYLADLVGLVYLGILLPGFREAQKWRDFALQEVIKEMEHQVYADGGDFEASTGYHRLVCELFLSATLLARLNGYAFSSPYLSRLEKMLEWIQALTLPDGTMPLFGDQDNGRLHRLRVWKTPEMEWVDFRYLLAVGAVLFERGDLALAARGAEEEAFWIFGVQAARFLERASRAVPAGPPKSVFPNSGMYILRHGSDALVMDCGPVGQDGVGGHAHADTFSFVLQSQGTTWITDPGTFVYTRDYEARRQFRSSANHNILQPDGIEQLIVDPHIPFAIQGSGQTRVLRWEENPEFILFQGEYRYPAHPAQFYERLVYLDRAAQVWWIQDALRPPAAACRIRFHFDHPLAARVVNAQTVQLVDPARGNRLLICCPDARPGELNIEPGWVSPGYGTRCSSSVLVWHPAPARVYRTAMGIEDEAFPARLAASLHRFSAQCMG